MISLLKSTKKHVHVRNKRNTNTIVILRGSGACEGHAPFLLPQYREIAQKLCNFAYVLKLNKWKR